MRILYHHRVASKDGQYVHIENIVNSLRAEGEDVSIVSPGFTEKADFGHDGGFVNKLKSKLPKFLYELMELGYGFVIAKKLIKEIKENRPDVIYERYNLYQPVGVLIAKSFKIPLILEVNAPLKEEREKYSGLGLPWLAGFLERYTWKNASKVLPVTDVLAEICVNSGVKKENVITIHNGITYQQRLDRVTDYVRLKDEIIIGFVGFMHLTCGVAEAIEVIAKLGNKKIKLKCIGDGEQADSLKKLAAELGVAEQVEILGLVARDEVMKHIDTFDIALQPDVTSYASPLKIFEYMVSKNLIIAPNSRNVKEILDDNSAIFFEYKDKASFASKLEYAIKNIEGLGYIRQNAFNTLNEKNFFWEANARKIISLAKELSE